MLVSITAKMPLYLKTESTGDTLSMSGDTLIPLLSRPLHQCNKLLHTLFSAAKVGFILRSLFAANVSIILSAGSEDRVWSSSQSTDDRTILSLTN